MSVYLPEAVTPPNPPPIKPAANCNVITIVVKLNSQNQHALYAVGLAGSNIAGERLSRSENFAVGPVRFVDAADAEAARARLQAHLDWYYGKKKR